MPFAERLEHHDALAPRHHHAGDADHLLFLHGVADDGEGFLADLVLGGEIVRRVAIAIVDRSLGHELLDVDRMRAFDRDLGELLVFDLDVLALGRPRSL